MFIIIVKYKSWIIILFHQNLVLRDIMNTISISYTFIHISYYKNKFIYIYRFECDIYTIKLITLHSNILFPKKIFKKIIIIRIVDYRMRLKSSKRQYLLLKQQKIVDNRTSFDCFPKDDRFYIRNSWLLHQF